jgi:hypothetical protein
MISRRAQESDQRSYNMHPNYVPIEIVDETASLLSCFQAASQYRAVNQTHISDLFLALPRALRRAPCFLCNLTNEWLYEFGRPIDRLPGGDAVIGSHMFIPVERLLDVLICARQRLNQRQFDKYMRRLSSTDKHQDVLAEMLPALLLDPAVKAEFGVVGQGEGNHDVDWCVYPVTGSPILLEVKHRIFDLIHGLARICEGERKSDGTAPPPIHDTEKLFRDSVEKFIHRDPCECRQGVWIVTQLMQERSELYNVFQKAEFSRLHFAIINNWQKEAYILARDEIDINELASTFNVVLSQKFVFERADSIER